MNNSTIPTRRKIAASLFALAATWPSHVSTSSQLQELPHINHFYTGDTNARIGIVAFTGDNDRIANALKLYMQNKADHLLITGYEITRYENPAALAASLKINVTRDLSGITFDPVALNTCTSAHNTGQWARENNLNFIIGVTSDYHSARTRILLQNALPYDTGINMWAIPSANPDNKAWVESLKLTATQIGVCGIPGYQIPGI